MRLVNTYDPIYKKKRKKARSRVLDDKLKICPSCQLFPSVGQDFSRLACAWCIKLLNTQFLCQCQQMVNFHKKRYKQIMTNTLLNLNKKSVSKNNLSMFYREAITHLFSPARSPTHSTQCRSFSLEPTVATQVRLPTNVATDDIRK